MRFLHAGVCSTSVHSGYSEPMSRSGPLSSRGATGVDEAGIDARWQTLRSRLRELAGPRPGKKWLRSAAALLEEFGHEAARENLIAELRGEPEPALGSDEVVELAGLVEPDDQLMRALACLVEQSYRRIPGKGVAAMGFGNLCVKVLASYGLAAAPHLTALSARARYPFARQRLDRELNCLAETNDLSRTELEELGVPDFGLSGRGELTVPVGAASAELVITSSLRVELSWRTAAGRVQKSVPAQLRHEESRGLAAVKNQRRSIANALSAQRQRLEALLQSERAWNFENWRARYVEHGLVGPLARRLVWQVTANRRSVLVIEREGKLVDVSGSPVDAPPTASVRLWHPLDSDAATVSAWRAFVEGQRIRQPFRQAHREVYRYGKEDGPSLRRSTRFAGTVIRQAQVAGLFRARGWSYAQQGSWSPSDCAHKDLLGIGLVATLGVSQLAMRSGLELTDTYVTIGDLSFSPTAFGEPVPLRDVPGRLFSEVLRDVALFAAVPQVATAPDWETAPAELRTYYEKAAFTPLSGLGEIRRDFLSRRLCAIPESDRLTLDECSLIVRGELHTYRIHLDTATVVIDKGGPVIFVGEEIGRHSHAMLEALLPFEDATLELVLTAAMVLAHDSDISDPFLRVQLQR